MTDATEPTPVAQRTWRSRLIEVAVWAFSPLAIIIVGHVLAAILGASGPRVIVVASLVALGFGGFFLLRPSRRFHVGRARAAGLVYAGIFTALTQIPAPPATEEISPPAETATTADAAPTPARTEPDAGPTLYPWPFDAPSVTLACRNPTARRAGMVTATTPDGREYAVNGTARSRYPDVDPIWLDDPQVAGLKVNIGGAIDRGLALCLGANRAASPLRVTPGQAPPPPVQTAQVSETLPTIDDSAFSLRIVSVEESGNAVRGQIETNMPLPIEIMVGVSLRGQRDDDIYIGNDQRVRITASPQSFSIPTTTSRGGLPSGEYDVEATFYPRWGGANGPPEARAITREIRATRRITLRGTGGSARDAAARNEAQRWLMENTATGDRWNPAEFERRMGPSERMRVTNRTEIIVAYYFPRADATVFVNTLRNELVTWRLGRHDSL